MVASLDSPREVGRYVLHGVLATGGMATVHLGVLRGDEGFARTVAIKRLHPHLAQDPDFTAMFLEEARLASRIRHPNVVSVIDVLSEAGELLLVMEYVQGESLSRLVRIVTKRGENIPPPIVSAIVCDALEGLHAAHEATDQQGRPLGIVHRDVSPQNILVGADGVTRVLDFGVAKASGSGQVTREGELKGKLAYMAPEQLHGSVTRATDVHAMGIVLWELLTGRRLFSRENEGDTVTQILMGNVGAPSKEGGSPEAYDAVVLKALAKEPAERFGSAREMSIALAECAPKAGPHEVAGWIERVAKKELKARLELISRVETDAGPSRAPHELSTTKHTPPKTSLAQDSRSQTAGPARTNLAPMATRFFGRESDLARLEKLVREGRRTLTLVGPGGAGKTRLARRFAELHANTRTYRGGVWFCDLTDARDLGGVLASIGHALDVPLAQAATADRAIESLARSIAARGPTMLVLDNCEQVVDAAARVVTRIGELAPEAIQITTSRESLRTPGEQVHRVSPLAIESEGDQPADAVRMFIDRAQSAWPEFAPAPDDESALLEIVRRLDGLPLAIELAASRIGVFSLSTIRQRLAERFSLLAGGPRFAAERQRTMRGAIDWSWDLLAKTEQAALSQCAIFQGGFALEAAEQILDSSALGEDRSILDLLQSLVDKSLVEIRHLPELGERRYRLYESVREYALEKLRASGAEAAALARHCAYFAQAGAQWAKRAAEGTTPEPRTRLGVELENLLAAHRRALEMAPSTPGLANVAFTLLRAISELLKRRGPLELLLSVLDATLADAVTARADPALVGEALRDRAYGRHFAPGGSAGKIADLTRALEIARTTKDPQLELSCLSVFASVELLNGDPEAARVHVKIGLGRARELGDPRATAKALSDLGACDLSVGRFEEARASFQEAITLTRRTGDQLACALDLAHLAEALIELGRLDEATERVEEGLALARPFGHHRLLVSLSGVRGGIEYERGQLALARAYFDQALEFAREWGGELLEPVYRSFRGAVLADEDDIASSAEDLDYAEAQLPRFGDAPLLFAVTSLCRGHLDLARARAAAARGDMEQVVVHRSLAEKRLDGLRDFKHFFEDLRPMRRRLERALARSSDRETLQLAARDDHDGADALVVAEDGSWFCVPGGARVDVSHRPNLQRLLVSLTKHRIGAAGEALSLDAIVRSGWPGERADRASAANRARVALARLRKLGLGDVLLSKDGYLLDPDVPIVIARTRSA